MGGVDNKITVVFCWLFGHSLLLLLLLLLRASLGGGVLWVSGEWGG